MRATRLNLAAVPDIGLIAPDDDLAAIIARALRSANMIPERGDILVVAQKIVSKAEGRYVRLADVTPSPRAVEIAVTVRKDPRLVEVILSETEDIVRAAPDVLIVAHRLGFVMANAGVDQSNVDHAEGERVLLLPRDPDASCDVLKTRLDAEFGVPLGVVMNDSFGRPWRVGVTGVALGAAGIPSLRNMVGAPDLFGRAMRVTEVAVADEIAAAASLVMGQGAEGSPVVLVRGLEWDEPAQPARALLRPRHRDLFR